MPHKHKHDIEKGNKKNKKENKVIPAATSDIAQKIQSEPKTSSLEEKKKHSKKQNKLPQKESSTSSDTTSEESSDSQSDKNVPVPKHSTLTTKKLPPVPVSTDSDSTSSTDSDWSSSSTTTTSSESDTSISDSDSDAKSTEQKPQNKKHNHSPHTLPSTSSSSSSTPENSTVPKQNLPPSVQDTPPPAKVISKQATQEMTDEVAFSNLPRQASEDQIREFCEQFGEISFVYLFFSILSYLIYSLLTP